MVENVSIYKSILVNLNGILPKLEAVYKDIHSHPELSMRENRTAGVAADHLRSAGYEVTTGVGKTGVVGSQDLTGSSKKSRRERGKTTTANSRSTPP